MRTTVNINVASLATGNLDHDDGRRLYRAIRSALLADRDILIDFAGLDIITPSFLNTSFRILARQYAYAFLKSRVKIVNSNPLINRMIRDALTQQ
jgi:hypothetical protein